VLHQTPTRAPLPPRRLGGRPPRQRQRQLLAGASTPILRPDLCQRPARRAKSTFAVLCDGVPPSAHAASPVTRSRARTRCSQLAGARGIPKVIADTPVVWHTRMSDAISSAQPGCTLGPDLARDRVRRAGCWLCRTSRSLSPRRPLSATNPGSSRGVSGSDRDVPDRARRTGMSVRLNKAANRVPQATPIRQGGIPTARPIEPITLCDKLTGGESSSWPPRH
jgi:hypothetical protein